MTDERSMEETSETSHATFHRNVATADPAEAPPAAPEAEDTDEWLTLNEAAALAGVAKSTAWRAWRNGRLEGMEQRGRILISRSSALSLRAEMESTPAARNVSETKQTFDSNVAQHSAHFTETPVPFHAFQEVLDRLQRLDRENVGLHLALQQHRLALEENARSIVEREARAREAEARLEESDSATARLEQEVMTRRKAEEAAQANAEEARMVRQRAELAEWRAQQAAEEAQQAKAAAEAMRKALEDERGRSWWQKLLGR